jgi:mycothiol synthase
VPTALNLPPGYTQRPLVRADAAAVTAAMAASELADIGRVEIEEADIVGEWQRPSYDVSATSVGVFSGDTLVAYAECFGSFRADATVHPDHRGRGIGTALAGWVAEKAAEIGQPVIGMPNLQGSPGEVLLRDLGWFVRWESWVLALPEGAAIPERPLPLGYAVREATPDDHEACWNLIEDAFLEWSEREKDSLEDWLATVTGRPGFEPWNLRVVTDPAGGVVAACHVLAAGGGDGYVNKIATRRDRRGLGLAQALLADAFAAARAHGAARATRSTDSRTGALAVYEKVGMRVVETWVHRAITTKLSAPA